jgi:hypothetical protein
VFFPSFPRGKHSENVAPKRLETCWLTTADLTRVGRV